MCGRAQPLCTATLLHGQMKPAPSPDSILPGCGCPHCNAGSLLRGKQRAKFCFASPVQLQKHHWRAPWLVKQHALGSVLGRICLWCQTKLFHKGPPFRKASLNFPSAAAMQYLCQLSTIKTFLKIWSEWYRLSSTTTKKGSAHGCSFQKLLIGHICFCHL